MPFEPIRYLLNAIVIERQGVERARSRQLALLPTLLDVSLVESVILSTVVGRREAPAPVAPTVRVDVPDVVGKPVEAATDELSTVDLAVSVQEQEDTKHAGLVISQDPAPKSRVPAGTVVTLVVGTKHAARSTKATG